MAEATVAAKDVVIVLEELGLETWQAEQAANDPRIVWDDEALRACVEFVMRSTADRPAAVLWSQVGKRHSLPRASRRAPKLTLLTEDSPGPVICSWCKEDTAICQGMHGWAAKYRNMTADEIYPGITEAPKHPPRRTRKGPNTT